MLFREVLDNGAAETVVKNVVLHRADDFASSCKELDRRGIQGLDPTGIDHRGRNPLFFQRRGGFERKFDHGAEGDDCRTRAVTENFGLADFEDARSLFRFCAGADAARIADGNGTGMVIGHRPKHVAKFILVLGLHMDDSGNRPEVADVEKAVVSRAVIA